MIKSLVSALISLLMLFSSALPSAFSLGKHTNDNMIDLSKFTLVWSDEFNGDSLDRSKWGYEWWVTERKGGYWHEDMVSVKDGNLVISAQYIDHPLENRYYEQWGSLELPQTILFYRRIFPWQ